MLPLPRPLNIQPGKPVMPVISLGGNNGSVSKRIRTPLTGRTLERCSCNSHRTGGSTALLPPRLLHQAARRVRFQVVSHGLALEPDNNSPLATSATRNQVPTAAQYTVYPLCRARPQQPTFLFPGHGMAIHPKCRQSAHVPRMVITVTLTLRPVTKRSIRP